MLKSLRNKPWQNTTELANRLGVLRTNVRDKLRLSKRQGLVRDSMSRMRGPLGGPIMVHLWDLTESGRAWLSERAI